MNTLIDFLHNNIHNNNYDASHCVLHIKGFQLQESVCEVCVSTTKQIMN